MWSDGLTWCSPRRSRTPHAPQRRRTRTVNDVRSACASSAVPVARVPGKRLHRPAPLACCRSRWGARRVHRAGPPRAVASPAVSRKKQGRPWSERSTPIPPAPRRCGCYRDVRSRARRAGAESLTRDPGRLRQLARGPRQEGHPRWPSVACRPRVPPIGDRVTTGTNRRMLVSGCSLRPAVDTPTAAFSNASENQTNDDSAAFPRMSVQSGAVASCVGGSYGGFGRPARTIFVGTRPAAAQRPSRVEPPLRPPPYSTSPVDKPREWTTRDGHPRRF